MSKAGVKYQSVASPVIRDKDKALEAFKAWTSESNPNKQNQLAFSSFLLPAEDEMYRAAEQLCADNDLVIGHYFHYPLQTAAEKAGRHYVSILMFHGLVPSSTQPPPGLPHRGKLSNRLYWWLASSLLNRSFKPYPDRLRVAHGLKPARDMLRDVFASHELTLIPVSPQLCQPQKDWPSQYQVCGFLDMPNLSMEGEVSAGLEEFLSRGDPPVYMTFGSVMPADILSQREAVRLFSEAARMANCRAIIQSPSWQECGFVSTSAVYYVQASPHSRVFPRCRVIIHHGGAGTTQAAALAGKPSIVLALAADQQSWGLELQRLGIAPRPLPRSKVTAEQLAKSIKSVVGSTEMSRKARDIGTAMSRENGVGTAVRLINERFKT
jgi:UDP:flavonoid glycosyltransferase YjiC (YdhE family)